MKNSLDVSGSILRLFFFFLPFFYWPPAVVKYEVPKVLLLYGITWLLVVLLCMEVLVKKRALKYNKTMVSLQLMFVVVAVVSSVAGESFSHSFFGNFFRLDGLLTLFHLLLFSVLVQEYGAQSFLRIIVTPIALGALALSSVATGLAVLKLFGLIPSIFWNNAVGVGFGNPVLLAGYIVTALPWLWFLLQQRHASATQKTIALVLMTGGLLATQSYIALAGLFVWVAIIVVQKKWWGKNQLTWVALCALCGALSIGIIWSWDAQKTIFIGESRWRIANKLIRASLEKPLLGYGVAHVGTAFETINWPWSFELEFDIYLDKAHSTLLEVYITMGLIGLFSYLYLLKYAFDRLKIKERESSYSKEKKLFFISFLLIYLWHSQTNVVSIAEDILFWTALGVIAQS